MGIHNWTAEKHIIPTQNQVLEIAQSEVKSSYAHNYVLNEHYYAQNFENHTCTWDSTCQMEVLISVVLVWLHIIRFSFSKKAIKEQKFSFSFS